MVQTPRAKRGTSVALVAALATLLMPGADVGAQRRSCQGRTCWPEGARPAWLDAAQAVFEGMEAPVLAGGRIQARARLYAPSGLDPATCVLTATWRGTRQGGPGRREPIAGEARSGPPLHRVPTPAGTEVATFELDAPLPGTQVALETYAHVTCGGVSFSLSSTDNVVSTGDVLPLLCALRTPAGTPAAVHVRLRPAVQHIRIGARFGVVLRRRGTVLFDACSTRPVLDTATLGVPIAGVGVPEMGALTQRDRVLALWGVQYSADDGSRVVRSFHGFNGDWLGIQLARPATAAEVARLRSAFAGVRVLAWVNTMDDVPQPGDPVD